MRLRPVPPITDEALLSAHLGGDRAAFAVLWSRHRGALLGYATRLVQSSTEAEEIVQQAFLQVVDQRWRPEGDLRAWLFTVVHRLGLDVLRRRRRWMGILLWRREEPVLEAPDRHLRTEERSIALERALDAIPTEHRAVLLLYYGQELPSKEVARVLGCEDHQVRSRLSYARRLLREQLAGTELP